MDLQRPRNGDPPASPARESSSRGTRWIASPRYWLLLLLVFAVTLPIAWLTREARVRHTPQGVAEAFLNRASNGQTWLALGLGSHESVLNQQTKDVAHLRNAPLSAEEHYSDGSTSVVLSSTIRDNRRRQGQLAIEMTSTPRGWWITDVDFVPLASKAAWLQNFTRRHPQAAEQRAKP